MVSVCNMTKPCTNLFFKELPKIGVFKNSRRQYSRKLYIFKAFQVPCTSNEVKNSSKSSVLNPYTNFWRVSCFSSLFAHNTKFPNNTFPPTPLMTSHSGKLAIIPRGGGKIYSFRTPPPLISGTWKIFEKYFWRSITWPHEGIWEKYEGICEKYEGVCGIYEGICGKYVKNMKESLPSYMVS